MLERVELGAQNRKNNTVDHHISFSVHTCHILSRNFSWCLTGGLFQNVAPCLSGSLAISPLEGVGISFETCSKWMHINAPFLTGNFQNICWQIRGLFSDSAKGITCVPCDGSVNWTSGSQSLSSDIWSGSRPIMLAGRCTPCSEISFRCSTTRFTCTSRC